MTDFPAHPEHAPPENPETGAAERSFPREQELSLSAMRRLVGGVCLALLAALALGSYLAYRQQLRSANRIVCFGDSLTATGGWDGRYSDYLARALPGCEVINKGISGDTLAGGRRRFPYDVLLLHPKVVIIELGANDFLQARRPIGALRADLEYMIALARDAGIGVVLAGVFGEQRDARGRLVPKKYAEGSPELGRKILAMERELARQYGSLHIENIQTGLNDPRYWADTRHPNAEGNRLVAQRILPAVRKLLKQAGRPSRRPSD